MKSGATLTAVITDGNGTPANVQYQWYADGKEISAATGQTYQPQWTDVGKTLSVQATYTDNDGYAEKPRSAESAPVTYGIHNHAEYGRYVDVREFGADPVGQQDSQAAIDAAMQIAHQEGVALYLGEGTLKISKQITLNQAVGNVTAIFGAGKDATSVIFDKEQSKKSFNPNSNKDDTTKDAGILVDGVDGKKIGDLAVKYTGEFYRPGQTYFGMVNGIQANDTNNTTIQRVGVSGANRAGVSFTSTKYINNDLMGRMERGEIKVEDIQVNQGNKIIDSHLYENRVAGVLVNYQQDFEAAGNMLARNGHEKDGGTGYGLALAAGSYNNRINIHDNTTDHNYRKGLDVHDGNNITMVNNKLNGDRLYGIAFEVRSASLRGALIENNEITMDPAFHTFTDDDLPNNKGYDDYWGIHIETNSMNKSIPSEQPAEFIVRNNIIKGLQDFNRSSEVYGILFRNHEKNDLKYKLDISNNHISGTSADFAINTSSDSMGPGEITLHRNTVDIDTINSLPIYMKDSFGGGRATTLAREGKISITENNITVRHSNGWADLIEFEENRVKSYEISNNTFNIGGLDKPLIGILVSHPSLIGTPDIQINNNIFNTDVPAVRRDWVQIKGNSDVTYEGNTYNGAAITRAPFKAYILEELKLVENDADIPPKADETHGDGADTKSADDTSGYTLNLQVRPLELDLNHALPGKAQAATDKPVLTLDKLLTFSENILAASNQEHKMPQIDSLEIRYAEHGSPTNGPEDEIPLYLLL